MELPGEIFLAFLAGVLTPAGAVCVLPLYPAFLAHLAGPGSRELAAGRALRIGSAAFAGILISMLCAGLIFTFIFRTALSSATYWLIPLLYGVLLVVSIFMILGADIRIPHVGSVLRIPGSPLAQSFMFGMFFGLIALPCNPGPLILLFAISSSAISAIENFFVFLAFGLGMAIPLLLISLALAIRPDMTAAFLSRYKRELQIFSGIVLLAISVLYFTALLLK